ncbi:hypothetical protein S83_023819 [Arachis hypogaea]
MITIIWNVRGAASGAFRRIYKEMMKQYKPDITILLETKCSGQVARNVIKQLGYTNYIIEEAQGFAGGIWICWNRNDINIISIEAHQQYIHVKVQECGRGEWFFTTVYASPHQQIRRELWPKLQNIANTVSGEWLIAGDFNEIKDSSEKRGGAPTDLRACNAFTNWINNCGLIDLGFISSRFTWRGPQWKSQERIFERLDRAMANSSWRNRFHEATVEVLTRMKSDHHPLLITTEKRLNGIKDRPFRFEAM